MISIIVPVYNVEEYLSKCLDSILAQTLTEWECILVDDGSTDRGGILCDDYTRKDSRFKTIHQENRGLSVARRIGLSHAKGEFIGWVDSDDHIDPDYFEKLHIAIIEHNVDMVSCNIREIKEDKVKETNQYSGNNDANSVLVAILRRDIRASMWNRLYRRSAIEKSRAIFFDRELCPIMEDTQFNTQFLLSNPSVFHVDYSGYNYLIREGSLSVQSDRINWWSRVNKANETVYQLLDNWSDKQTIRYRKSMFKAMMYGEKMIPDKMFYNLYPDIRLINKGATIDKIRIEIFFATFGLRGLIRNVRSIMGH